MSGCALWLIFLIGANGGLLGGLIVLNKRAAAMLAQAEQAKENAVREFARWRERNERAGSAPGAKP